MTKGRHVFPKRRLALFSLAAVLTLVAFSLVALPDHPKADSGKAAIAKKKKRGKITGKLTRRGYTVIALARDGGAKTKRAPKGKFKLRPRTGKMTLHLRGPDGTYAGPVVIGTRNKGKQAIVGVKAGAKLGKVVVKPAKGYAKVKKLNKKQRKKWLDKKRYARAKKGVPIGAGNFGRVRSKKTKGGAPGDLDLDGIANPLDVDDDGDRVLDELDPTPRGGSKAAGEAQTAQNIEGPRGLGAFTSLLPLGGLPNDVAMMLNANLPGVEKADIDAALKANSSLTVFVDLGGDPEEFKIEPSAGLECRGLSYCSAGGTGAIRDWGTGLLPDLPFDTDPEPWPGEPGGPYDADGDGLGDIPQDPPGNPDDLALYGLAPNATSDEIATGDVLLAQVNYPGFGQREVTYSLQTVFATYPLLVSYTDELGTTRELTYPLTGGLLPVVDGPDADSDIEVTLNFWRPQRRAIPEEVQSGTEWVDVGGLQYFVDLVSPGGPGCPESSFAESDPNLSLNTIKGKGGILDPPLSDSAPDRPASPTNTFTFTLNLSDCLAANGFPKEPPGGRGTVGFGARLPDALNYVGYQIGFQAVP